MRIREGPGGQAGGQWNDAAGRNADDPSDDPGQHPGDPDRSGSVRVAGGRGRVGCRRPDRIGPARVRGARGIGADAGHASVHVCVADSRFDPDGHTAGELCHRCFPAEHEPEPIDAVSAADLGWRRAGLRQELRGPRRRRDLAPVCRCRQAAHGAKGVNAINTMRLFASYNLVSDLQACSRVNSAQELRDDECTWARVGSHRNRPQPGLGVCRVRHEHGDDGARFSA